MTVPPKLQITPNITKRAWARFQEKWDKCTRCDLHMFRQRVVHARGRFPCSVLFVGEAPGQTEDSIGYPFVGRSGKLLTEYFIPSIQRQLGSKFTYAIVNAVGCIPLNESLGIRPPTEEEIKLCRDHLNGLAYMALAKACILLGKSAFRSVGDHIVGRNMQTIPTHETYHPAYLLRQGGHTCDAFATCTTQCVQYLASRL